MNCVQPHAQDHFGESRILRPDLNRQICFMEHIEVQEEWHMSCSAQSNLALVCMDMHGRLGRHVKVRHISINGLSFLKKNLL